jgi:mannose-6-phosphate isomerase-like protein (cupin superfamily)
MRFKNNAFILMAFTMVLGMRMVYGDNHDAVAAMVTAWKQFVYEIKDWQELVKPYKAHHVACGIVYELPNFLSRPHEDFAIVDMRTILFAEPHYHPEGVVEVYMVLQGGATIVVGTHEYRVGPGDVVVIPSLTAHFTIPNSNFVIAVINTPPYRPEDYFPLTASNDTVCFDQQQFVRLCGKESSSTRVKTIS